MDLKRATARIGCQATGSKNNDPNETRAGTHKNSRVWSSSRETDWTLRPTTSAARPTAGTTPRPRSTTRVCGSRCRLWVSKERVSWFARCHTPALPHAAHSIPSRAGIAWHHLSQSLLPDTIHTDAAVYSALLPHLPPVRRKLTQNSPLTHARSQVRTTYLRVKTVACALSTLLQSRGGGHG